MSKERFILRELKACRHYLRALKELKIEIHGDIKDIMRQVDLLARLFEHIDNAIDLLEDEEDGI